MTPVPPLLVVPVLAAISVVNLLERGFGARSFRLTKVLSGLLLVAIGARAAYWFVVDGLPGFSSEHWIAVSAMVDSATLKESYSGHGPEWAADIAYSYSVAGKMYESRIVTFPARRGVRYLADATLSRFPVGQSVRAYYNPSNPAQACLEPGGSWWFALVAGGLTVVFLSTGIWVLRTLTNT